MRAQLSLEFMVYTALSAASLVSCLYMFTLGYGMLYSSEERAYMQGFVAEVNSNMAYYQSQFRAFVPGAICSSRATSDSIVYSNQSYTFGSNVSVDIGALCAGSGSVALVRMSREANGTFEVGG